MRDVSPAPLPVWEARAPGRFQRELNDLKEVVGDSLTIDDAALADGVLVVSFDWPLRTGAVALRATYPDSFPRMRPIVSLRDRSAFPERHCSPLDGNLCLLGRNTRQWRHKWTLRHLLELQLKDALTGGGDEDQQGEPAEYWWNCGRRGSYCLIDSAWTLEGATAGTLKMRYALMKESGSSEVRAVVTEVRDRAGKTVHAWSGAIPEEIAVGRTVEIPWVYVDETVLPDGTANSIFELVKRFPEPPRLNAIGSQTAQWFGVLYKMETGFHTDGVGWLFPFIYGAKRVFRPAKAGKRQRSPTVTILPTLRAGESDIAARVPAVHVLQNKRIAVVGLGALGAPLAVDLARNGCGKLHLLDHDVVEPGNSIRWALGASAWGDGKAESLATFIRREYPWTEVEEHNHAIGSFGEGQRDEAVLSSIINNVDLVIDGAASYGVSTILSDFCRSTGVPVIALDASPPVNGGTVARYAPQSGCPTCLEFAYSAGIIERAPGYGNELGLQQPPGCAERTFTGASFDLQELSLQAMRLAVDTLTTPDDATESVVCSLSFVTPDGHRTPPSWRVDALPVRAECSCSKAA